MRCYNFWSSAPCLECGEGLLVYQSGAGYRCSSETTKIREDPRWIRPVKITKKCRVLVLNPRRVKFRVPELYKKRFNFLKVYKSKLVPGLSPAFLDCLKFSILELNLNTTL